MIIRENEMVVGMLDERSLKLTEVESVRLQLLVDEWRKEGLARLIPGEEDDAGSFDDLVMVPFTSENIALFEVELATQGFDVQTA